MSDREVAPRDADAVADAVAAERARVVRYLEARVTALVAAGDRAGAEHLAHAVAAIERGAHRPPAAVPRAPSEYIARGERLASAPTFDLAALLWHLGSDGLVAQWPQAEGRWCVWVRPGWPPTAAVASVLQQHGFEAPARPQDHAWMRRAAAPAFTAESVLPDGLPARVAPLVRAALVPGGSFSCIVVATVPARRRLSVDSQDAALAAPLTAAGFRRDASSGAPLPCWRLEIRGDTEPQR